MEQVKPYSNSQAGKKEQVAQMFNNIAGEYDFLNHFLSLNIDKIWRRKVIRIISKYHPKTILDIATGTGDLALAALKCNPEKIYGIDISEGMLEVGRGKIKKQHAENVIVLTQADAENIPFETNVFDAITVAFGVRNFEELDKGLSEMYRVLKPGGICTILEFTMPNKFPVKQLYKFYFKYLLPTIGKIFSKDNSAYTYLPESVAAFAQRQQLLLHLQSAGFTNTSYKLLSFGIAAIYICEKQ